MSDRSWDTDFITSLYRFAFSFLSSFWDFDPPSSTNSSSESRSESFSIILGDAFLLLKDLYPLFEMALPEAFARGEVPESLDAFLVSA